MLILISNKYISNLLSIKKEIESLNIKRDYYIQSLAKLDSETSKYKVYCDSLSIVVNKICGKIGEFKDCLDFLVSRGKAKIDIKTLNLDCLTLNNPLFSEDMDLITEKILSTSGSIYVR